MIANYITCFGLAFAEEKSTFIFKLITKVARGEMDPEQVIILNPLIWQNRQSNISNMMWWSIFIVENQLDISPALQHACCGWIG